MTSSVERSSGQGSKVAQTTALAEFERARPRLFGIAYRMMGTDTEAEDVVQDAWLRWQGADHGAVRNPESFLSTTVTGSRLNALTSARATRETYSGPWLPEPGVDRRRSRPRRRPRGGTREGRQVHPGRDHEVRRGFAPDIRPRQRLAGGADRSGRRAGHPALVRRRACWDQPADVRPQPAQTPAPAGADTGRRFVSRCLFRSRSPIVGRAPRVRRATRAGTPRARWSRRSRS